eukprot:SAG11_NODE_5492_length_1546_cov_4.692467_1_plen_190_part_00
MKPMGPCRAQRSRQLVERRHGTFRSIRRAHCFWLATKTQILWLHSELIKRQAALRLLDRAQWLHRPSRFALFKRIGKCTMSWNSVHCLFTHAHEHRQKQPLREPSGKFMKCIRHYCCWDKLHTQRRTKSFDCHAQSLGAAVDTLVRTKILQLYHTLRGIVTTGTYTLGTAQRYCTTTKNVLDLRTVCRS